MNAVVSEQLPAAAQQQANLPANPSDAAFNLVYRRAKAMSSASLVPQAYRDNIPNTMIALELADRIGASPMQVMQNLHIIQGKPSWSASFLIATVNACGRFSPMRFEITGGDDPHDKAYRVRAYANDLQSGERCDGPWITWRMVEAEGWEKKPGSKWKTMPGPMFMYRAASFWSRIFAPEVSMGIHTREEVEDVVGHVYSEAVQRTDHGNLKQLEASLSGQPTGAEEVSTGTDRVPEFTATAVRARIESAETVDELNDAFDLVRELPDAEQAGLVALYETRRDQLDELP